MQNPCQLCDVRAGQVTHWLYGAICYHCYDRMKWERWHEGITPVRKRN